MLKMFIQNITFFERHGNALIKRKQNSTKDFQKKSVVLYIYSKAQSITYIWNSLIQQCALKGVKIVFGKGLLVNKRVETQM